MRGVLRRPGVWLGLALAAVGLVIGQPLLALGGVAVALGSAAFGALRRAEVDTPEAGELGAEGRSLVRPLRDAQRRLSELAAQNAGRPEVAVVATEAAAEAETVVARATEIALARQRLKETIRGRGLAETELGRAERLLTEAKSDAERQALEAARASRTEQLKRLDEAQATVDALSARLRQAEAVLGELTASVTAASVSAQAQAIDREALDSALTGLRSFGTSLDEAAAMLEDRQR